MIEKFLNIIAITVASLIALLIGLIALAVGVPPLIWLMSFIDTTPEQNDCAIGSVTKEQFQRLLREAKAQDWTVWPGLSNGIFEPSDRGIKQPWPNLRRRQGEQLLSHIKELIVDHSADAQLAAAHAVMRSIGAEYGRAWVRPDFRPNGQLVSAKITFEYYVPQARFAPFCVLCLPWPTTSLQIVFHHDVLSDAHALDHIDVAHSNLKGVVEKTRNVSNSCPEFPSTPRGH
jgi:hypothetical protein